LISTRSSSISTDRADIAIYISPAVKPSLNLAAGNVDLMNDADCGDAAARMGVPRDPTSVSGGWRTLAT
jgi:hypothetical protein